MIPYVCHTAYFDVSEIEKTSPRDVYVVPLNLDGTPGMLMTEV